MYRNTPLLFALFVFVTSPAAIAAGEKSPASHAHPHATRLIHVNNTRDHALRKKDTPEVLAMRPQEADDWGVKLASAGPAPEITPPLARSEPEEPDLNVLGMIAAALGLGAMSIVRRMGRF